MHQEVSLMDVRAVLARCAISRPTLYRLLRDGRFPKPCYPGIKSPRWRSDAVAAWIERESSAGLK